MSWCDNNNWFGFFYWPPRCGPLLCTEASLGAVGFAAPRTIRLGGAAGGGLLRRLRPLAAGAKRE